MSAIDLLGLLGVVAIVVSYFLLQAERLRFDDWTYLLLNAGGAIAIILSLAISFNLPAMAMEVFWLLISLYGMAKRATRQNAG